MKVYELAHFDTMLCEHIHNEFEQPGRNGQSHVIKLTSALRFYLPIVKGSL